MIVYTLLEKETHIDDVVLVFQKARDAIGIAKDFMKRHKYKNTPIQERELQGVLYYAENGDGKCSVEVREQEVL